MKNIAEAIRESIGTNKRARASATIGQIEQMRFVADRFSKRGGVFYISRDSQAGGDAWSLIVIVAG